MRSTRPVDAASLLVYRQQAGNIEVLMGQRRSRAEFAPGVYVFPGGVLETADRQLHLPIGFDTSGLAARARTGLRALSHTAIRETFEETGLLLAGQGQFSCGAHPSWKHFRRMGKVPAPQYLSYLGRAITPADSPRRFHARFFVAAVDRFCGTLIDEGELLNLRWVNPHQADELPMWDVTLFMLEEFSRLLQGARTTTPVMSYRAGHTRVRYE